MEGKARHWFPTAGGRPEAGQSWRLEITLNEVENIDGFIGLAYNELSLFGRLKGTGEFLLHILTNVSSLVFHPGQ